MSENSKNAPSSILGSNKEDEEPDMAELHPAILMQKVRSQTGPKGKRGILRKNSIIGMAINSKAIAEGQEVFNKKMES